MSGFQTSDYSNSTCEVAKLTNTFQPNQHEVTIFRKPDGGEALWASLTRYLLKYDTVYDYNFFIVSSQQSLKFTELAWYVKNKDQFGLEEDFDTIGNLQS